MSTVTKNCYSLAINMEGFENDLNVIDPDINHFEPNINFELHSLTTFPNKQDIDPSSLKLIHHFARSLIAVIRTDEMI